MQRSGRLLTSTALKYIPLHSELDMVSLRRILSQYSDIQSSRLDSRILSYKKHFRQLYALVGRLRLILGRVEYATVIAINQALGWVLPPDNPYIADS